MSIYSRYIGIDYSGAQTPTSSIKGLRIYTADRENLPKEVQPPISHHKYWTRRGVAEWLVEVLQKDQTTIIGIDHGFSFPLRYFEYHHLPLDWNEFLDDFHHHWPTDGDNTCVDSVRNGSVGKGADRSGDSHWRRLTEEKAKSAKSVFQFDVKGQVAKSTHAGIPWLRYLRQNLGDRIHFWPFDGWGIRIGKSVILEVYPSLWSCSIPVGDRTPDQHDAYSVAYWLRQHDLDGQLPTYLNPPLTVAQQKTAQVEGWILGIM